MAPRYWLMKSEPSVFGIDHLRKKQVAPWDGVRNFMARNFMQAMKVGDGVLFYHSTDEPVGVAGIAEVAREAYPDHTSWDPKSDYFDRRSTPARPLWFMVDVRFVRKLDRLVPLAELRKEKALRGMILLRRGNRLSVTPVTPKQWARIVELSERASAADDRNRQRR